MKIEWPKALGYGLIIYAVAYIAATAFVAYKITPQANWMAWLVVTVLTVGVEYYLATRLDLTSNTQALTYGVIWVVMMFFLDLLLTVPFTGMSFFYNGQFVVGVVISLLPPLVAYKVKS